MSTKGVPLKAALVLAAAYNGQRWSCVVFSYVLAAHDLRRSGPLPALAQRLMTG